MRHATYIQYMQHRCVEQRDLMTAAATICPGYDAERMLLYRRLNDGHDFYGTGGELNSELLRSAR